MSTNTTVIDTDFTAFDEELEDSSSMPTFQILSPKGGTEKEIRSSNAKFGFLILKDDAEKVHFKPNYRWTNATGYFAAEDDNSDDTPWEGYLSNNPRFVIISMSALETQQFKDGRWVTVGLGKTNGQYNDLGIKGNDYGTKDFRNQVRMLVLFLDDDNTPLHTSPIKLSMRGAGFRGAFYGVWGDLTKQIKKTYQQMANKSGDLPLSVNSYVVADLKLDFKKSSKDKAPFVVPSGYKIATPDENAKPVTTTKDYQNKTVEITTEYLKSIFILPSSPTFQIIKDLREQYPDFAKLPGSKEDSQEIYSEPVKFLGTFDLETLNFKQDGTATIKAITNGNSVQLMVPKEQLEIFTTVNSSDTSYVIEGVKNNKGVVKPTSIALNQLDNYDDNAF